MPAPTEAAEVHAEAAGPSDRPPVPFVKGSVHERDGMIILDESDEEAAIPSKKRKAGEEGEPSTKRARHEEDDDVIEID